MRYEISTEPYGADPTKLFPADKLRQARQIPNQNIDILDLEADLFEWTSWAPGAILRLAQA